MTSLIRFFGDQHGSIERMPMGSYVSRAIIAIIVSASVFFRYVLNDSLSWSEELAKYAMLWLVFLGAPIALRLGVHPNIEIMISQFPKRVAQAILTIMHLAVFIFCAFLALKSHEFAWNGRTQVAIAGDVSMYWFFVSIPRVWGVWLLYLCSTFWRSASVV